jgi:hypothetical protein
VDDKARKEVGYGRDVAIDALDQFARAVLGVERGVEIEHVARQIGPQRVGSPPAEVLGHVCLGNCRDLGQNGDAEEQQRDQDEPLERLAGLGVVDEDFCDLGVG